MKIIVFGGAGFLGSHVADALSDAGHEVTVFDRKESPYLRDDQKFIQGDILDQRLLDDVIKLNDIVYHFAGIADIDECAERPVDTVRYNILGTVELLESSRKAKIKRFIFASSAYVFSDYGYFYKTSKQACESYLEDYQRLYGLNFTIIRYGSLYGPRADDRNSIHRMIKQALEEGKIQYRGTGDELREFIHVKDAAESSVKMLANEFENKNIILTGTQTLKYRELLDMIKEILGNKIEIEVLPGKRKAHYKMTPYNFSPKIGMKYINNPQIDLGQGLLACMADIYEKTHVEKFGVFIEQKK